MTPMYYALIAVVSAVGLIVLGLMYLLHVTGGDPAGYARHIEATANRLSTLLRELRGVHDGDDCPSKCTECPPRRAEINALIRDVPKPILAIGAVAYYGRKFVAPVGRGQR